MNRPLPLLFLALAVAAIPRLARAQSPAPMDFTVLSDGTVVITEGYRDVMTVLPQIFTGNFTTDWEGNFRFQEAERRTKDGDYNAYALVKGVRVTMRYQVDRLESGLHIRYVLIPQQPVEVSRVMACVYSSYAYWQGATYRINGNDGVVPAGQADAGVIRQGDSAPLSMGPSSALGGLESYFASGGLHLQLVDDRQSNNCLSVVYSHNDLGTNWVWEKGVEKDFDFTLTFNRMMRPLPGKPALKPPPNWTPVPTVPVRPIRMPTFTPLRIQTLTPLHFFTFTPTSTPALPSQTLAKARVVPIPRAQEFSPTPTAVLNWLPNLDPNQTIEFSAPPANLYVAFDDGPGEYRLDLVDPRRQLLETIYDKRIVTQSNAWVEWDGLDAKGKEVRPGRYYVILYKDGKALKSIAVVRSPPSP